MHMFHLDDRLHADCHRLHEAPSLTYLLHKNAEVAWFIIVPHVQQTEFFQLDAAAQKRLCDHINLVSTFIQAHFQTDKINVATIGNVVSQMHIHVIGRRKDDAYWPDVVWGKAGARSYGAAQLETVRASFDAFLRSV